MSGQAADPNEPGGQAQDRSEGRINTRGGDFVAQDKIIGGDEVRGDKVAGRKVEAVTYIEQATFLTGVVQAPEERGEAPAPGESPYKGLQYFDVADAALFFGREALTARLVGRLRQASFLAVVGASGSGKSSLVRAGLLPALQRGEALANGSLPEREARVGRCG